MRPLILTLVCALLHTATLAQFTKFLAILKGTDMPVSPGVDAKWSAYQLQKEVETRSFLKILPL